jgi:hypothetical protein
VKDCVQCKQPFEFKTHNQKYCSKECCRLATNKKIMQKYYIKKQRLAGAERLCAICKNQLSRYNADSKCTMCQETERKNKANIAKGNIQDVISKLGKAKSR